MAGKKFWIGNYPDVSTDQAGAAAAADLYNNVAASDAEQPNSVGAAHLPRLARPLGTANFDLNDSLKTKWDKFIQQSAVEAPENQAITSADVAAVASAQVDLTNMTDGSANNTLENIGDTSSDQSAPIERNFDKIGDEINALVTESGAHQAEINKITTDLVNLRNTVGSLIVLLQQHGLIASDG